MKSCSGTDSAFLADLQENLLLFALAKSTPVTVTGGPRDRGVEK